MEKIKELLSALSEKAFLDGRFRKSEICRFISRLICSYAGEDNPLLETVFTPGFLNGFKKNLLEADLSRNTVSFYMNAVRSVHSAAVKAGLIPANPELSASLRVKSVPTEKRAATDETIARLHAADLSAYPKLERCRDLFMLSFCFQGISFVDMLYLHKRDLNGSRLTYFRHKTDTLVSACVLSEFKEYLSRLQEGARQDTPRLLPFITRDGKDGRKQYQSILRQHNRWLKMLATHLKIAENLTSYVARHSWATMAHHNGVGIPVVSQAMGHRTEEMTHVYLSAFGLEHLREANLTVLNAVLRPIREGRISNVRETVRQQCVSVDRPKNDQVQEPSPRPEYRKNPAIPSGTYARQDARLDAGPYDYEKEYANRAERRRMEKLRRRNE